MKKVKITAEIQGANIRQSTFEFELEIADLTTSEDLIIEFVGSDDGGPLMRPKNPPR
jgi:hypothetical protein